MGLKNFGTVDLGDARRNQRLIDSAARIAATPQRSFNTIFDGNDLRGFDRFGDTTTATVDTLQQLTRQAMAQHPVVLIRYDTSEIDLTSHTARIDIGPIGDGRGRGFLPHNRLAIVPDTRHGLGLAHPHLRRRHPAPPHESSGQRPRRDRESVLGITGITATGPPPAGVTWVDGGDRAADDSEAMRRGHTRRTGSILPGIQAV